MLADDGWAPRFSSRSRLKVDHGCESRMSADENIPSPEQSRDAFAAQLRELETFMASTEADDLPPEAVEMMTRLREVVLALDGLTSTLGLASPDASANDNSSRSGQG